MFTYSVFDKISNIDDEKYISFGIKVEDTNGNVINSISDISTDEISVRLLCDRCNKGQLDPIHLRDVVEDYLV